MKHLIMGTAGHIDHGKTSLIQALTGVDCDTHPEEKSRGITINLGFAHIDLVNGASIGIVDVPGHRAFVNTMVAGASGIDFVMMTIAADSGMMPQTIEHMRILEILGIRAGVVALTKIDLVDEEMLMLVEEEIRKSFKGTFLHDCPILRVSAKSGDGIADLRDFLSQLDTTSAKRTAGDVFRMFIDRIFSMPGFGTVVAGSVISGQLKTNDTVHLLPDARELRVRRLERHKSEVPEVVAGDRASLNLVGLKREDFRRGMVVSSRAVKPTGMIDADLALFRSSQPLSVWTQAIFLLGTYEAQARIHLIDRDRLEGGQAGIVQIHLAAPCVCRYRDTFVIRSTSGDVTLGGGEIIDAYPLHHRRRTAKLCQALRTLADGGIAAAIAAEVRKRVSPIADAGLAELLNVRQQDIRDTLRASLPDDIASVGTPDAPYLMTNQLKENVEGEILRRLGGYHKDNPLDPGGRTCAELMGIFGTTRNVACENVMKLLLQAMAGAAVLKTVQNTWAIHSHNVELSSAVERQIEFIEQFHAESDMRTPLFSELTAAASTRSITEDRLNQILRYLTNSGKLYHTDGQFVHHTVVDRCRTTLLEHLGGNAEGITLAGFRDLVNGNRKICLLLMPLFDTEGVTRRVGDYRFITDEGREKLAG